MCIAVVFVVMEVDSAFNAMYIVLFNWIYIIFHQSFSHQSFRASRRRARDDLVTSRENMIPQDINHGFLLSPVILHNNEFTDMFRVINAKLTTNLTVILLCLQKCNRHFIMIYNWYL